jgi:hypothetical protein
MIASSRTSPSNGAGSSDSGGRLRSTAVSSVVSVAGCGSPASHQIAQHILVPVLNHPLEHLTAQQGRLPVSDCPLEHLPLHLILQRFPVLVQPQLPSFSDRLEIDNCPSPFSPQMATAELSVKTDEGAVDVICRTPSIF